MSPELRIGLLAVGASALAVLLVSEWENVTSVFDSEQPKFGTGLRPAFSDVPPRIEAPVEQPNIFQNNMKKIDDGQTMFRNAAVGRRVDMACFNGLMNDIDSNQEQLISIRQFLESGQGTPEERADALALANKLSHDIFSKMGNAQRMISGQPAFCA
ncbi:MAG: hypothetical protein AAB955_02635 [Patescibacteria group bacterium]